MNFIQDFEWNDKSIGFTTKWTFIFIYNFFFIWKTLFGAVNMLQK